MGQRDDDDRDDLDDDDDDDGDDDEQVHDDEPGHGHQHDLAHGSAPTPEQDLDLARKALESGDVKHAARHVACALGEDASNDDALAFADDLLSRVDDPLALVSLGDGVTSYALVAFRALALARLGELTEAIDLILQVVAVRPDVDYLSWVERWTRDERSLAAVEPMKLASSVKKLADGLLGSPSAAQFSDATFERVHEWLTELRRRIAPDSALAMMHAIMLRRAGRLDDALGVARAAHAASPDYRTSIAVGGALRAIRDLDGAAAAFEEASRFDPADVAALLDIGDIRLEQGRLDEALRAYGKALERDADDAWAVPSSLYVEHRLGRPDARTRLCDYAAANPGNQRAADLIADLSPWVGYLPVPAEATIDAVRQIVEKRAGALRGTAERPTIRLQLSAPECPSAIESAREALRALHPETRLVLTVDRVPTPDPRVARKDPKLVLWHFDGDVPRPAVPAPPADVSAQIAGLAREPFAPRVWKPRAHEVATWLGVEAADAVAATMAHPPPAPEGLPPWIWRQHVQVAAAFVIAALDNGWEGSVRARVLSDLVRGPVDWSVTAAVLAITEIALEHPKLEPTLGNLLAELYEARPAFGYWCVAHPLLTSLLRLPGLPKTWRERLSTELANLA